MADETQRPPCVRCRGAPRAGDVLDLRARLSTQARLVHLGESPATSRPARIVAAKHAVTFGMLEARRGEIWTKRSTDSSSPCSTICA
jgi:hypothetical protein